MDEDYVMPKAAIIQSIPPPGGINYALLVSYRDQPLEVYNIEKLRDKLIACGWNVDYFAGQSATLYNVISGLNTLKNVVGGGRVLIYFNDHSIITSTAPPEGTYTFENGILFYSELDNDLGAIAGNFTEEKVLFITGPRSGSSARCDHSIGVAGGFVILTSTDDTNNFGGGADPCDLADAWTSCGMLFQDAWGSLPPGGYSSPP